MATAPSSGHGTDVVLEQCAVRHAGFVVVRLRRGIDLPDCVQALQAVHAADGYPRCWPAEPATWLTPADIIEAWVAEGDDSKLTGHVCLVGNVDDPVVAAEAGVPTSRLAMVSRLFVAPSARGRGLGRVLLGALTKHAAAEQLRVMLDVVDDGGPAIQLYEQLGWQLVDERDADWETPKDRHIPLRIYLSPS